MSQKRLLVVPALLFIREQHYHYPALSLQESDEYFYVFESDEKMNKVKVIETDKYHPLTKFFNNDPKTILDKIILPILFFLKSLAVYRGKNIDIRTSEKFKIIGEGMKWVEEDKIFILEELLTGGYNLSLKDFLYKKAWKVFKNITIELPEYFRVIFESEEIKILTDFKKIIVIKYKEPFSTSGAITIYNIPQ